MPHEAWALEHTVDLDIFNPPRSLAEQNRRLSEARLLESGQQPDPLDPGPLSGKAVFPAVRFPHRVKPRKQILLSAPLSYNHGTNGAMTNA